MGKFQVYYTPICSLLNFDDAKFGASNLHLSKIMEKQPSGAQPPSLDKER